MEVVHINHIGESATSNLYRKDWFRELRIGYVKTCNGRAFSGTKVLELAVPMARIGSLNATSYIKNMRRTCWTKARRIAVFAHRRLLEQEQLLLSPLAATRTARTFRHQKPLSERNPGVKRSQSVSSNLRMSTNAHTLT
jgi:hypothetical protein